RRLVTARETRDGRVGNLHMRLARLELRRAPRTMGGLALAYERGRARLSREDLHLLEAAEKLRQNGREGELAPEHHAALQREEDLFMEELESLAPWERPGIAEMDEILAAEQV